MERNLHEDLEICNAATEGPWVKDYHGGYCVEATSIPSWGGGVIVASCGERADARFIAEARDGWPHAIERALSAEAEVERLCGLLEGVRSLASEFDYMGIIDYLGGEEEVLG
ncbi:hypothetical protein [Brevibacillus laterosporus]|uniref:hypothetical protein n=1 Tax=Brevibacillus laterosporus TaxID=1465 RepID=UPI0026562E61|nr:hypothetical protein [Brevibacillus laterosporus]MDN9010014.1 hypothetical protein [Brevibacillus laterosporus]MDO0940604.1 hypothetical protein [Brevibacillus laterosporus]